ncbi:ParD-like family protein [Muricoccus vinaceus]|uniref:ParD-like family protein n=2 Tax=Muricoccus vinaceus TaxID=424704 RepID=A0ABV6IQA8_9PROT
MVHTRTMCCIVAGLPMGIVKIDDELHEEARRASAVMCRSINAQAEFWMKIGMLTEANPTLALNDIVEAQLVTAKVRIVKVAAA